MPKSPPHPCAKSGCPNLTYGRFCKEHTTEENRRYEKYDRTYDSKKRYGRAWKRIRDKHAQEFPYCENCFSKGILVPVEEVHHKISISEGGTHAKENLISLCHSCHAQIHAQRGDRWHKKDHVYTYGPEIKHPGGSN